MARIFRPAKVASSLLPGIAIALFSPVAAFAASVTLVCNSLPRPEDPPITIDLDEGKRTATLNYPAQTIPSSPPQHRPARSVGPLAANFNPKEIGFSWASSDNTVFDVYKIDRITGTMTQYFSHGAKFEQAEPRLRTIIRWACQVGKARF